MNMDIKCDCGGTYHRVILERFDFSALAGLPTELRGAPGLRCDRCGGETLQGDVISAALVALAQKILALPRVLTPQEARFLRKRLQLSQKDLAERMSITRETVAAWECGQKPLSPQNDYILRGLHFGAHLPTGAQPFPQETREQALGRVHSRVETAAAPEPFIIASELARMSEMAVHA
jgi:DNA-binding transcriptional regulator YiaG